MSFYENNKEWLEGWSFDDGEYCCKGYLLSVPEDRFLCLVCRGHKIVLVENDYAQFPEYEFINMCNHFTDWKQPTEQEQDMFEMLYGVRLPWKHFVD